MRRTAMIDVSMVAASRARAGSPIETLAKEGVVADAVQAGVGASATTPK